MAQARVSHDKIAAILQAADLGLQDVVRLVDYVTVEGMADYPRLAELRRELFGETQPVISTVVVQQLLRPTAYIEIEAVASRHDSTVISTANAQRVLSRRMGDVVYISAQLPLVPGTDDVAGPGDLIAQTRQIYDNTTPLLERAGLGWEHVVKTVEFFTAAALPQYRDTGRVRREYLGPNFPAATGIIMPAVAHPDAMIQIDFVACAAPKSTINPGWSRYAELTYVPGVKAGHLLCLAGQGA